MLPAFTPLHFRTLTIKNPILRASGMGLSLRTWELEFARAGIGAIISACAKPPSALRGDTIAAWQEHVGRIHAYRCAYILRIGEAGSPDAALGITQLREVVRRFADTARCARETGADGIEIDGSSGSTIARLREIVGAVGDAVGPDLHLQVRLGVASPLAMQVGGTLELARWLEVGGVDAIHLTADGDSPGTRSSHSIAIATRFIRESVSIPVLRNGAFAAPGEIIAALGDGSCDAVTLARPFRRAPAATEGLLRRAG